MKNQIIEYTICSLGPNTRPVIVPRCLVAIPLDIDVILKNFNGQIV